LLFDCERFIVDHFEVWFICHGFYFLLFFSSCLLAKRYQIFLKKIFLYRVPFRDE
jgi:hypothetical protein